MQPLYDREAVRPLWEELAACGVEPLTSPEAVDAALAEPGTTLIVVNSVCGCAGGIARPGVLRALQHTTIPDRLGTVFAGVDREATERAREHMTGIPPSSPSIALFKDGRLVFVLERRDIEGTSEEAVADALRRAFDEHCTRPGPSVPAEVFDRVLEERRERFGPPLVDPFRL